MCERVVFSCETIFTGLFAALHLVCFFFRFFWKTVKTLLCLSVHHKGMQPMTESSHNIQTPLHNKSELHSVIKTNDMSDCMAWLSERTGWKFFFNGEAREGAKKKIQGSLRVF